MRLYFRRHIFLGKRFLGFIVQFVFDFITACIKPAIITMLNTVFNAINTVLSRVCVHIGISW